MEVDLRHVHAVILGAWYSLVLSVACFSPIRDLSATISFDHYILEMTSALAGVFVAGTFATALSRSHSLPVSLSAAMPSVAITAFLLLLEKKGILHVQAWLVLVYPALAIVSSYCAGVVVHRILDEEPGDGHLMFLGVPLSHWCWLWVPMAIWAYLIVCLMYLGWLSLATDWYWACPGSA